MHGTRLAGGQLSQCSSLSPSNYVATRLEGTVLRVSGNRKQDKITLRMGYEEVGQGISKSERQIQ